MAARQFVLLSWKSKAVNKRWFAIHDFCLGPEPNWHQVRRKQGSGLNKFNRQTDRQTDRLRVLTWLPKPHDLDQVQTLHNDTKQPTLRSSLNQKRPWLEPCCETNSARAKGKGCRQSYVNQDYHTYAQQYTLRVLRGSVRPRNLGTLTSLKHPLQGALHVNMLTTRKNTLLMTLQLPTVR